MARTISFMNHKGGVGKTCSVCNVGAYLANIGHKTLLIDLDPQANLSNCFGIGDPDISIDDVLFGKALPMEAVVGIHENLDVIPSSLTLCTTELRLYLEPGRELFLKNAINKINYEYDFILVDCPPALGVFTTNALSASEEVYIPLEPNHHAVRGIYAIVEIIKTIKERLNSKVDLSGIFITRFDKRKVLDRDIVEGMYNFFESLMLKTRIRNNVALSEAVGKKQDIFRYNSTCNGAIDYSELTKEIVARNGIFATKEKIEILK